ncbi:rifin [Plasmodium falciparum NF54]|uniref:Rifin n=2 Tax=Plasmodium falciparum TaxID=5833 RepID=A0A143ZYB5_PLAF7|nr:rifin [Plasmodium falciparum 3D7]EWC88883.1 hypothetical protein PFNF54_02397 [Plasmodium falciparum NF54]KAF4330292.1 rifin [Plasmodium falciparum NF54]PKC46190.1 rifin [Plasmodium falciparum NF54]CZT62768.1 rifin [Plasmodium falciparum 3D7]|eukprot:XP_002808737.1 rifin [Plasmodium falciparum 3D7]
MKLHFTNILLFSLPLNIFVTSSHLNNQQNIYKTSNTSNFIALKTCRSLCECDPYISIYDNHPEMQKVMENFKKQTEQRFREYDKIMKDKLQKCKEQCDRDIQKIILKEKIQKELTETLAALETNIDINDIPTCDCEKSVSDKVEKTCLKCGGILGTTIPKLALLGGISTHMLTTAATSAAIEAGMKAVVASLKDFFSSFSRNTVDLTSIVNPSSYNCSNVLLQNAKNLTKTICIPNTDGSITPFCSAIDYNAKLTFDGFVQAGTLAYDAKLSSETSAITSFNIAMMSSIVAIVIIVLFIVIIYLILHYRRKKKNKKKLQYIKLLKE